MKIFKSKYFHRWASSEGLSDDALKKAVKEIEDGLDVVSLGGGLYKKRVMRVGQGKRGSYRTLIAFKKDDIALFVYGFAKNEQENIGLKELAVYKKLAGYYLGLTKDELDHFLGNKSLIEVLS